MSNKVTIEFVDQNGEQFWTDPEGRILRHDPERCTCPEHARTHTDERETL